MAINFPGALDDNDSLHLVANSIVTTLDGALAADANGNQGDPNTIHVVDTTGFPAVGLILIDAEVISYTGKTGITFTGTTRAQDGTVTAIHIDGSDVKLAIVAAHHNDSKDAIIAIETELGARPKAYGQAYRIVDYPIAVANVWEAVGLTGGNNDLRNVSHDEGGANPERIIVTYEGIYKISYNLTFTNPTLGFVYMTRIVKNVGVVELVGSYRAGSHATGNFSPVGGMCIASLSASDYIVLQVQSNHADTAIDDVDVGGMTDPTTFITVNVTIEKIG